jgi:hypothetical protein
VSRDVDATLPKETDMPIVWVMPTNAEANVGDFVADRKIVRTAYGDSRMSSTSPIVKRNMIAIVKARAPLMHIDQNIARGTAQRAIRVSSPMCATPSNPANVSGVLK